VFGRDQRPRSWAMAARSGGARLHAPALSLILSLSGFASGERRGCGEVGLLAPRAARGVAATGYRVTCCRAVPSEAAPATNT